VLCLTCLMDEEQLPLQLHESLHTSINWKWSQVSSQSQSQQLPPKCWNRLLLFYTFTALLPHVLDLICCIAYVFHAQQSCCYDISFTVHEVHEYECLIFWDSLLVFFIYLFIIHIIIKWWCLIYLCWSSKPQSQNSLN